MRRTATIIFAVLISTAPAITLGIQVKDFYVDKNSADTANLSKKFECVYQSEQNLNIQQTFSQQPSDQEVNPGVDVVMACRVANKAAQSECIWQKGRNWNWSLKFQILSKRNFSNIAL